MAPGAWMTGFYIGDTYLENNVLTYFENRFSKLIKGKNDYLKQLGNVGELNFNTQERNVSVQPSTLLTNRFILQ